MNNTELRLVGSADAESVDLGKYLNTVEGNRTCPTCRHHGVMKVYEAGVQWACGCVRMLPPLYAVKFRTFPRGARRESKGERGRRAAA